MLGILISLDYHELWLHFYWKYTYNLFKLCESLSESLFQNLGHSISHFLYSKQQKNKIS